jgi:hypothetical protein
MVASAGKLIRAEFDREGRQGSLRTHADVRHRKCETHTTTALCVPVAIKATLPSPCLMTASGHMLSATSRPVAAGHSVITLLAGRDAVLLTRRTPGSWHNGRGVVVLLLTILYFWSECGGTVKCATYSSLVTDTGIVSILLNGTSNRLDLSST